MFHSLSLTASIEVEIEVTSSLVPGERFELSCKSPQSDNIENQRWMKDDEVLEDGMNDFSISDFTVEGVYVLVLTGSSYSHQYSGVYTCIGSNGTTVSDSLTITTAGNVILP